MDEATAVLYGEITEVMAMALDNLRLWNKRLEGAEREDVAFHIVEIAKAYRRLAVCVSDHELGIE